MKNLILGILAAVSSVSASAQTSARTIKLEVTERGFVPNSIEVKPDTDVTLEVTRKTDKTCAKDIQVPSKGIKATKLPLRKPVTIALGKLEKGEIKFGCGMDMMDSGKILIQ